MIQVHLNKDAIETHWEMINASIAKRVKKVVDNNGKLILGNGRNRISVNASDNLFRFLKMINNKKRLSWYLRLTDVDLKKLILLAEEHLSSVIDRRKNVKSRTDDYRIVQSIFYDHGYEHKNFSKLRFIEKLDIHSCPYCNRNYTYYLTTKGKIKPEIDHFYPKKIYPFLAASFYNLIPSCQTCNGFGGKGEEDTFTKSIISPYTLNHGDFEFSYDITSIALINPISSPNSIRIKFIKGFSSNIDMFKLEQLYQKHEDHALELIFKARFKYSEKYREYLKSFTNLGVSDKDIDRLIIGNYSTIEELHKRPLSKLYLDIAKKEGLI